MSIDVEVTEPPMRVALLAHGGFGGSGVFASELARALAEHGQIVDLFVPEVPPRLRRQSHGVRIHPLADPEARCRAIVDLHRTRGIDVLHAHFAWPHGELALRAGLGCEQSIPVESRDVRSPVRVLTLHGSDVPSEDGATQHLRELSRGFDRVTAVSHWLLERAQEANRHSRDIQMLPNFIPSRFLGQSTHRSFGQGPLRVLHASTLSDPKDPRNLLATLALAARTLARCGLPGFRARILSESRSACIQGLFDTHLDGSSSLELAPAAPRIEAELDATDLVLLASRRESFSLLALEAQARGIPVLAPSVGGLPEVVQHGETGWLVSPGDPDPAPPEGGSAPLRRLRAHWRALGAAEGETGLPAAQPVAGALARALAVFAGTPEGRDQLATLGAAGPPWVARRFHPDRIIPEWLALYRGALASPTRRRSSADCRTTGVPRPSGPPSTP